jgi:hypothetical protein
VDTADSDQQAWKNGFERRLSHSRTKYFISLITNNTQSNMIPMNRPQIFLNLHCLLKVSSVYFYCYDGPLHTPAVATVNSERQNVSTTRALELKRRSYLDGGFVRKPISVFRTLIFDPRDQLMAQLGYPDATGRATCGIG